MARKAVPQQSHEEWIAEINQRRAALAVEVGADLEQFVREEFHRWCLEITPSIARHFDEYETLIGLPQPNPDFRHAVTEAVMWCLVINYMKPKNYADIRKELENVREKAKAVTKSIRELYSAYNSLPPAYQGGLDKASELHGFTTFEKLTDEASKYYIFSQDADRFVERLRPLKKGGPNEMFAFQALVIELKKAFLAATGASPRLSPSDRNTFLNLLEAVLSFVVLAAAKWKCPMRVPPSRSARMAYIYRHSRH